MYILFDIGATNIRFARSKDLRTFESLIVTPNTNDYMSDMVTIKNMVDEISEGQEITGVAGGVAGMFDKEKGVLIESPNMKSWVGKPLSEDLRRFIGKKPIIVNDADCSGLGEAVFGAGYGYRVVAYMTVSTGIGGSLIINNQI